MEGKKHLLTQLDKKVLNLIQNEFPATSRPYKTIADKVRATEDEVFQVVKKLKEEKVIRRLGGVFDSISLGFSSTLVALKVSHDCLEEVGGRIGELEGVTHSYQRNHDFNLWFTLVAPSREDLKNTLSSINDFPGVEKLLDLPALHLFKIGVNFNI